MTEQLKKINNPLTIIAIFAALAEVNATIAIGLIDKSLHYIFIWFIIAFPTILVVLFFATLNFNTKVMYSPSDYREDKTFLDSLFGQPKIKTGSNKLDINTSSQVLQEFEDKILSLIDDKIASKPISNGGDTKSILESYKSDVKQLIEKTKTESTKKLNLPEELKSQIIKWISYPALIPIVYAIYKENAVSISDLKKVEEKYNLSAGWDKNGIKSLSQSFLDITDESFTIKPELKDFFTSWVLVNEHILVSITKAFEKSYKESKYTKADIEEARLIAQNLVV